MPKPDELFIHDREPNPAWQADLDRIAPPGQNVNWLKIAWLPGEPYEPVQRWAIWEVVVDRTTWPPGIAEALDGLDPKLDGQWVYDEDLGRKRWFSNSIVDHMQWKLYRVTHGFPNLTWIIQGSNGGHLRRLGPAHKAILAQEGFSQDIDVPNPGDLPYADYDERVSSKLAQIDRLRKWRMGVNWDERGMSKTTAGLWVRRDRHEAERQYRMELMKWLDSQIEDAFQDVSRSSLPGPSDFQGTKPEYIDLDKLEEEFVEDTGTLVTSEAE